MSDDIETVLAHGAAVVLLELKKLEQGYTGLTVAHKAVVAGTAAAKAQAEARGLEPDTVTAQAVMERAQALGASGADAHIVAEKTLKAPDPEPAEPEAANEA